jgi:hypothetical protein
MKIKIVFVTFITCLLIFSLQVSYANTKEPLRENALTHISARVEKDSERIRQLRQSGIDDEPEREKHMAVVDECFDKFNACAETCGNSSCEDRCLGALSDCEKDVPLDLKTLKE